MAPQQPTVIEWVPCGVTNMPALCHFLWGGEN